MIDVVIRLETVTGAGGRPLDDAEADLLADTLTSHVARVVTSMAYHAASAKGAAEVVPLDAQADRLLEPTIAHQADQARRRAWHEDDTL